MANKFDTQIAHVQKEIVSAFDKNTPLAERVDKYTPTGSVLERAGGTIRRDVPMISRTTSGFDTTGQDGSITELTVPNSINKNDMENVVFDLDADELRDQRRLQRKVQSAIQGLYTHVEGAIADAVSLRGGNVLTRTGAFTSAADFGSARASMARLGLAAGDPRHLVLHPDAAVQASDELAARHTDNSRDMDAYTNLSLFRVAGFPAVESDNLPRLAASDVTPVTVTGADQFTTPEAFSDTNTDSDHRVQNLTISDSAARNVGDAFYFDGVNEVHMINKKDTGRRRTFRITRIIDGTTVEITPAIIPVDQQASDTAIAEHANCTTAPGNGDALVFLNTDEVQTSVFFRQDAVELMVATPDLSKMDAGVNWRSLDSEVGVPLMFGYESGLDPWSVRFKLSLRVRAHVQDPLRCGVLLENQAQDFG